MPVLDQRDHNRMIPITFNGQEKFQGALPQEYVSLSMISNEEYDFLLNGKKYHKKAPFFLSCTSSIVPRQFSIRLDECWLELRSEILYNL